MKKTVVAIALTLTAAVALACGPEKMFEQLNLSDDQKTQLQALHKEKREDMASHKENRQQWMEKSKALLQNYSQEQAELLADEIAADTKAKSLARFEHMHKVSEILTEEQRQQFLTMMEERKGKGPWGGERKGHHGPMDW